MCVLHLVVVRTSDAGVDGDAGVVEQVHAGRRVEDRIPQHPAEQHQAHAEAVPARKTEAISTPHSRHDLVAITSLSLVR
jgi:hypothetical protein